MVQPWARVENTAFGLAADFVRGLGRSKRDNCRMRAPAGRSSGSGQTDGRERPRLDRGRGVGHDFARGVECHPNRAVRFPVERDDYAKFAAMAAFAEAESLAVVNRKTVFYAPHLSPPPEGRRLF